MSETRSELQAALRLYREANAALAEQERVLDALREAFEQSPQGQELARARMVATQAVAHEKACEATLREAMLADYQAHGEAHPLLGVRVVTQTKLTFDVQQAIAWCKANAPVYLVTSLDQKAFAKAVPNMPGDPPITLEEVPVVQVMHKEIAEMLAREALEKAIAEERAKLPPAGGQVSPSS